MELTIINPETTNIAEKFGISKERAIELLDAVETEYYSVRRDSFVPLVKHYANIARSCNNIEEYTLCMHSFIMNLRKIGKPVDDPEFIN